MSGNQSLRARIPLYNEDVVTVLLLTTLHYWDVILDAILCNLLMMQE